MSQCIYFFEHSFFFSTRFKLGYGGLYLFPHLENKIFVNGLIGTLSVMYLEQTKQNKVKLGKLIFVWSLTYVDLKLKSHQLGFHFE